MKDTKINIKDTVQKLFKALLLSKFDFALI